MPLIVENERILADKGKLLKLSDKKFTTDLEKQWIRQKLMNIKLKKSERISCWNGYYTNLHGTRKQ